MDNGNVSGSPAVFLNQGMLYNLNVIVLLVEAMEEISDFNAASQLSNVIISLIPGISCDNSLLLHEAERIEKEMIKIGKSDDNDLDIWIN